MFLPSPANPPLTFQFLTHIRKRHVCAKKEGIPKTPQLCTTISDKDKRREWNK